MSLKEIIILVTHILPDKLYVCIAYRVRVGKKLNLKNPQTFNEKLQWLKLYDRNPIYTTMVDKYEAKKYVAECIGEQYIIPTLGVWEQFDDIDFDALPKQFVLKCTHDSGGVVICRDREKLDIEAARKKIEKSLKRNYYWSGREWPYKNIKPRIIAEQYMEDGVTQELRDYKVFCFDGIPKVIQVDFGRFTNHERNLYSTQWEYLGFTSLYPTNPEVVIPKPESLDEMLDLAAKLSNGIPHIRVDMYVVNNKIYFGELTLYHGGGTEKYTPSEWDKRLGDWLVLPLK